MRRHPPAFQIDVKLGRAWILALAALLAASLASLLWRLLCLLDESMDQGGLAMLAGLVSVLVATSLARRLRGRPPQSLRWDGQVWLLGPAARRGSESWRGELKLMADLGDWMLLCFVDAAPHSFRRRRSWLALSRADAQQQWHLLRSTIYSTADHAGAVTTDTGAH